MIKQHSHDESASAAATARVAATDVFPPGRYGRRRSGRKRRPWLVAVLAGLVVLGTTGLAYRLYAQYGDGDFTTRILAETERTDDRVTIRFEVQSRDGAHPATCLVRARARDGLVIGSAEVPVPAGKRVERSYTLSTSARTFVVEIPRCWRATNRR